GTGLVDLAFFDDSHAACAHTVFHSWLLLVRGVVQRRGARSLSVVGAAAWNLAELAELRRTGGLDAVAERLAQVPEPEGGHPAPDEAPAGDDGRRMRFRRVGGGPPDAAGYAGLLALLGSFTPVVEAAPPDGALADVRGALRYFGRDARGLASVIRVRALALHGADCAIGAAP
ncbi:DNA polymerase III, partial [Streptomyces sp. DT225]